MIGVVNGTKTPSTPLTQDLVPIPDSEARKKKKWDIKHRREFVQDGTRRVRNTVLARLDALERKIGESLLEFLSGDERTSLVQLSEAIVEHQSDSIKRSKDELEEGRCLDRVFRSLELLSTEVESVLQEGLRDKRPTVISAIIAHRLAELRVAGLIDSPGSLTRPVGSRIASCQERVTGLDTNEILAVADEILERGEIPCLRRTLEHIVPEPIADTLVTINSTIDNQDLVAWAASNREALEARYLELVRKSLFARPGAPARLLPAVRRGVIGVDLAILLASKRCADDWNPENELFVHHCPHRPPRVLESVALTGAANVTLIGDLREHAGPVEEDVTRLLRLTTLLTKYYPTLAQRAYLSHNFVTGEELLNAELADGLLKCEGRFVHSHPPREISLLERATQGSVAWVANPKGEIVATIIFDARRSPSEAEWKSAKIAEGWWHAVPVKKIKIASVPWMPHIPAKIESDTTKVPMAAPAATHVLSESGRADLTAWLEIADKSGLFKDDPTFSGSIDATALLGSLRQAAKGQALNSKAFRSIRKLSESFDDPRRRPILRAPRLHDVRDKLGVFLATELSARA